MKFLTTIILCCLVLTGFGNPSPESKLSKEIRKQIGNVNFSLDTLSTDSKGSHGCFFRIKAESKSTLKYIYQGRINTVRGDKQASEDSEYFDYFILYDSSGTIQTVKITSYNASHGEMICSPSWLKGFKGYRPDKVLEIGHQLDAISGATISVNKLTFDIKRNSAILFSLIK